MVGLALEALGLTWGFTSLGSLFVWLMAMLR